MASRFTKLKERSAHFIDPKDERIETIKISIPEFGYKPDLKDTYRIADKIDKEDYHIIGKGKYSHVIAARFNKKYVEDPGKAEEDPDWISVACKRYNNELERAFDGYFRLKREVQICRNQRHENIVRFYEVFAESEKKGIPRAVWLVSERMDHTLETYYDHLNTGMGDVDIRHLGGLLTQLLHALDYLHQRGIMHRKVTPGSIGMNQENFEIKLLDFGSAREINPYLDHSTNVETRHHYKSIEILMKVKYDTKVDIWSTALVAIEMLGIKLFKPTGTPEEIEQKNRKRGAENAVKDRIFEVLGVPEGKYSSLFGRPVPQELCPSILQKELRESTIRKIREDINPLKKEDFYALMEEMLDPNIRMRPRADECLQHRFLKILNLKYHQETKPRNATEMKEMNDTAKEELFNELDAGYNRLYFADVKSSLKKSSEKENQVI